MPITFFAPNMFNILKLYKKTLDLLYPFYCLSCKNFLEEGYLCKNCLESLDFHLKIICPKCQRRKPVSEGFKLLCCNYCLRSLVYFVDYEKEVIKELIKLGKFSGYYKIWEFIGDLISNELNKFNLENFYITYVPMTKKELINRGFNQTKILAKVLAKRLNLKIFDGLVKIKETKQQALLDFKERFNNIKDAFNCKKSAPKNIILIDDVFTTGATLEEISKTLKKCGAKIIIGITFAK